MPRSLPSATRGLPNSRRIQAARRRLLLWYGASGRTFIWRRKSASEYVKIVAEVLLQRTQAGTVDRFFRRFLKAYPSWRALAAANIGDLEGLLKPIGLWRRRAESLNALATARNAMRQFPADRQLLEQLPGVGQYVANAIELIVFHRAVPLVDSNMARVVTRYFGPGSLADIRYDPWIQGIAGRLVADEKALEINWAILDLAATICRPRSPNCLACPLASHCLHARGQTDVFGTNTKQPALPHPEQQVEP